MNNNSKITKITIEGEATYEKTDLGLIIKTNIDPRTIEQLSQLTLSIDAILLVDFGLEGNRDIDNDRFESDNKIYQLDFISNDKNIYFKAYCKSWRWKEMKRISSSDYFYTGVAHIHLSCASPPIFESGTK